MKIKTVYHCDECSKESADRYDQCEDHPEANMSPIIKRTSRGQVTYQSAGYAD